MNQVINDSIHEKQEATTIGFFVTNSGATVSTGGNNNGWRRFRRNGIVPHFFFTYLRESGIIRPGAWIPGRRDCGRRIAGFFEMLPVSSPSKRGRPATISSGKSSKLISLS